MEPDAVLSIQKFLKKVDGRVNAAKIAIAEALVTRVKELTPVRTGRLRAGWMATTDDQVIPVGAELGALEADLTTTNWEDPIKIINTVEYARSVEYGAVRVDSDGVVHHGQGRHMLAQTLSEAPEIARKAVREAIQL